MPLLETSHPSGALHWQLRNPNRKNAVDPDALATMARRAPELKGEIVVLEGELPGPFCAGFDLTHLDTASAQLPDTPLATATAALNAADATFVGAVRGYAIGAGVELMTCCDLVVAEENAWFRVPAAELGVLYHRAGFQRIRHRFGSALARRLILLAERISAAEARLVGAVTHTTAPEDLSPTVSTIVERLLATDPAVLAGHRNLFRAAREGKEDPVGPYETARAALYARRRQQS